MPVHKDDADEEEEERRRTPQQQQQEEEEEQGDSDGGGSTSSSDQEDDLHELPEWVSVDLSTVCVNVRCPICLGIIKKTRTMMDCLHRFCRECIDRSMRQGNNECPACRKHCASRRSLRDDPRFDAFIQSLFDDVEKYEEEELAFQEEDETRNKQIQESIAKISQKQTEALVKKRKKRGKDAHSAFSTGEQRRASRKRGRKRNEPEESEDYEEQDNDNVNKESSSGDERKIGNKKIRYTRKLNQPSLSAAKSDSSDTENEVEVSNEEIKDCVVAPMQTPERFTWGGAGVRSKTSKNARLKRLTRCLESKNEKDLELDVNLMLISPDEQQLPDLQQSFLSCPPNLTVAHLKEHVAFEVPFLKNDIDILLVKKQPCFNNPELSVGLSTSTLEEQKTLAEVRAESASDGDQLIMAYQIKMGN